MTRDSNTKLFDDDMTRRVKQCIYANVERHVCCMEQSQTFFEMALEGKQKGQHGCDVDELRADAMAEWLRERFPAGLDCVDWEAVALEVISASKKFPSWRGVGDGNDLSANGRINAVRFHLDELCAAASDNSQRGNPTLKP